MEDEIQLRGPDLIRYHRGSAGNNNAGTGPGIVVYDIRSPENAGAILRTADAVGSGNVTFVGDDIGSYQLSQPRVRKLARSAVRTVSWEIWSKDTFLKRIEQFRPLVAVEVTSRSANLFATDFPIDCTLMVGSERHGIPDDVLSLTDFSVHIPMFGTGSSMNVACALSVVAFEWRRQEQLRTG